MCNIYAVDRISSIFSDFIRSRIFCRHMLLPLNEQFLGHYRFVSRLNLHDSIAYQCVCALIWYRHVCHYASQSTMRKHVSHSQSWISDCNIRSNSRCVMWLCACVNLERDKDIDYTRFCITFRFGMLGMCTGVVHTYFHSRIHVIQGHVGWLRGTSFWPQHCIPFEFCYHGIAFRIHTIVSLFFVSPIHEMIERIFSCP